MIVSIATLAAVFGASFLASLLALAILEKKMSARSDALNLSVARLQASVDALVARDGTPDPDLAPAVDKAIDAINAVADKADAS